MAQFGTGQHALGWGSDHFQSAGRRFESCRGHKTHQVSGYVPPIWGIVGSPESQLLYRAGWASSCEDVTEWDAAGTFKERERRGGRAARM